MGGISVGPGLKLFGRLGTILMALAALGMFTA